MNIVREYTGIPLTMRRITPGNTLTKIDAGVWKYVEYEIGYDAGHAAALIVEGNVITGATSGAIGIVKSVTIVTGSIATSDAAGKIRFHSWNGVTFTDNEKIKVAADADVGDIDGTTPTACVDDYRYKGWIAKSLLVVAETNTQRLAFGGNLILPDQTTKYGIPLAANSSILISDAEAIKNLYVVDGTAGSAGSIVAMGFF